MENFEPCLLGLSCISVLVLQHERQVNQGRKAGQTPVFTQSRFILMQSTKEYGLLVIFDQTFTSLSVKQELELRNTEAANKSSGKAREMDVLNVINLSKSQQSRVPPLLFYFKAT